MKAPSEERIFEGASFGSRINNGSSVDRNFGPIIDTQAQSASATPATPRVQRSGENRARSAMIKKFRTDRKHDRYLRQIESDLAKYRAVLNHPHVTLMDSSTITRVWELIDNRLETWLKVHDRLVTAEMDRRNDS